MKTTRTQALLLCVVLAGPLTAQDALEGTVQLIGAVQQKLTYTAPGWTDTATSAWALTTDLQPKFRYGPVSFQAVTTVTWPMTKPLETRAPVVAVPEAYFRIRPTDTLDLTFGQKRFNLGVGQTFTVGDSINPAVGFFDQKTGFAGATAEWSPTSWLAATAAISTASNQADDWAGAGQLAVLLDRLQLTGSLSSRPDKTFSPALGASFDLAGIILTAEGAAEFLPQGLRPQGAASTWAAPEAWSEPAYSGSAGARWTVTVADIDWTVAAEYLHWGQGFAASETDDWRAALAGGGTSSALAGAARAGLALRSQENAFLRFSAVWGTQASLTSFAAVDLQDQSLLGQVILTWAPWDNLELSASLQAAGGDAGSSWEYLNTNQDRYQASLATTYHF